MTVVERGIKEGLISVSEDNITYLSSNITRRKTPEELVQVEIYIQLILKYNYKPQRIKFEVPIKMGADTKRADIVVYNDDKLEIPFILVECKKQEVSEQELQQAINQAYSYAYAMPNDVKYLWVTSGLKDIFLEVDKQRATRVVVADIPQFGVKKLASYKYVYGANELQIKEGTQRFSELETIGQDELTKRFKQAHNALWAGGQLNPSEAFDELDKLIFCKIWDEKKDRKEGTPYDFQIFSIDKKEEPNEQIRTKIENDKLYERVRALYEEGRKKDPEVFRDNIRLSPEKIRTVVGYLESVNLSDTDLDSKGRAFETFMDSFFRGNFGQYFTPRSIVEFTTDVLPITNESKVLDTSCGSGGFLLYALNKVRKAANELYPNYKKDINQAHRHRKYWHDFAENNLFGIEINEQISRVAKMNMIIHDDGHTNVVTLDGLLRPETIKEQTENPHFLYDSFDFIITNPPFGSAVKLTEKAYLKTYNLGESDVSWLDTKNTAVKNRDSQSTEVLFIEQAYYFLKEKGYLGVVIPDGILTNSSLQYVRNQIEDWYRIIAVVSLPQSAFTATGAGVKSSVLFLQKWSQTETDTIKKQKKTLQDSIKIENNYLQKVDTLEKEKQQIIKEHKGFDNTTDEIDIKLIEKTEEFKAWKKEIADEYNQKITDLKDELTEIYQIKKAQTLVSYPIFMAIAEDIGYDASGRETKVNELDFIAKELKSFIDKIEKEEQ